MSSEPGLLAGAHGAGRQAQHPSLHPPRRSPPHCGEQRARLARWRSLRRPAVTRLDASRRRPSPSRFSTWLFSSGMEITRSGGWVGWKLRHWFGVVI
ncbi:hypothetical protein YM304_24070 [Ilumatobacter coccineus YM16-304]|uniref:Uncharacterized protein n=1 Tax=Ilumatobacter coccineus (strain NBRC 103263 / KCTC 29153 / YM16-304) TaxID=1313172 RepID=A0A6C7E8D2_ILUCY|nr:hypothetical protein YM304_24070 [Ilumatobacter coccineus YM16-304]